MTTKLPVALQLYSVRDELARDFIGTLEAVADIGYSGVEFAGFGGVPAIQVKNALDNLGLAAVGSHTSLNLLTEDLEAVIEYNRILGNRYIICPYNTYKSKEDFVKAAELYNETGEKIRAQGLEFLYHNHDFEFEKYDGEYGLDIIFKGAKPENVAAEIDSGWVFYAGVDPVGYIKSYTGRCPLVHIKDFKSTSGRSFTEVGTGIADIEAIAAAAVEAGTKWLVVEQDESAMPSFDSVRLSLENLKKMGLA